MFFFCLSLCFVSSSSSLKLCLHALVNRFPRPEAFQCFTGLSWQFSLKMWRSWKAYIFDITFMLCLHNGERGKKQSHVLVPLFCCSSFILIWKVFLSSIFFVCFFVLFLFFFTNNQTCSHMQCFELVYSCILAHISSHTLPLSFRKPSQHAAERHVMFFRNSV